MYILLIPGLTLILLSYFKTQINRVIFSFFSVVTRPWTIIHGINSMSGASWLRVVPPLWEQSQKVIKRCLMGNWTSFWFLAIPVVPWAAAAAGVYQKVRTFVKTVMNIYDWDWQFIMKCVKLKCNFPVETNFKQTNLLMYVSGHCVSGELQF